MATNQFQYPVYNYAVGWFNRQPNDIIDHIAPAFAVDGITGSIKRYPQGYAFRSLDTARALYQEASTINLGAEDVPYLLADHSLRIGVDDSELKPGAGSRPEAADQIAQSKMNSLLATWRTSKIKQCLEHFRTGIKKSTGGNWSSPTSDPIEELTGIIKNYRLTNGVAPNRILLSDAAWDILGANAAVLDRVTYNAAKCLTPELLLQLLGLVGNGMEEVKFMRATVPMGSVQPGPSTSFVGTNALESDMWLSYVDDNESIGNMTGLRMLHMGGETPVETVESYYERSKRTTYYEVGLHRMPFIAAPSCVARYSIT